MQQHNLAPRNVVAKAESPRLQIKHLQEIVHSQTVVSGNSFENARERACLDRMMKWFSPSRWVVTRMCDPFCRVAS